MNDEELDYMSDAVLLGAAKDVRPGLVYQPTLKRKYEAEKRQQEANRRSYMKPKKILEEERRNEVLGTAIPQENIGFQMLKRMGYKPGTGIGKSTRDTAIVEPIRPVVKTGRSGLGQEEEDKRKSEDRIKKVMEDHLQRSRNVEKLTVDFRDRLREERNNRKTSRDLYQSQKVCLQIETEMGVEKPRESWFWPEVVQEKQDDNEDSSEEQEEDDDGLDPFEKLQALTSHLRTLYFYCIWCGARFDDSEDLAANCPGPTSEDHD